VPRKSIVVFNNEEINIGWFACDASKTKFFRVSVGSDTKINKIEIYLRAEISGGTCCGSYVRFIANNQEVAELDDWCWDEKPRDTWVDGTSIIYVGDNVVTVSCFKPIYCFAPRTYRVTVIVVIDYEGKEPDVTPPSPVWFENLIWLIPIAVISAIAGIVIGYKARGGKGESRGGK